MAASEARRAANARNAQKSTGPRSDEGKKSSSMNALKHGLTAVQAVVSNEDPADYQATLDQWLAFDQPTDPAHAAVIERARLRQVEAGPLHTPRNATSLGKGAPRRRPRTTSRRRPKPRRSAAD